MLKKLLFSILLIGLTACGGGGGGGGSSPRTLASLWTADSDGAILDLSGIVVGSPATISFFATGGAVCSCSLTTNGDGINGTYTLTSCSYSSGGSGDPGCGSLNQLGQYAVASNALSLCQSGSCQSYR